MPLALTSPPLQSPLTEPPSMGKQPTYLITRVWSDWFNGIVQRAQTASYAVASTTLTVQNASIGVTALVPSAAQGRYRVTVHARVTTVDGVASSLIPVISYTNGGVACTQSGAALTSNNTGLPASWTFAVIADASTPISFATTYASTTPGQMKYTIDFLTEQL